jgi:hypothetical protein
VRGAEKAPAICPLKGIDKVIEFSLDELNGGKQNVKKSNSKQKFYFIFCSLPASMHFIFCLLFLLVLSEPCRRKNEKG